MKLRKILELFVPGWSFIIVDHNGNKIYTGDKYQCKDLYDEKIDFITFDVDYDFEVYVRIHLK